MVVLGPPEGLGGLDAGDDGRGKTPTGVHLVSHPFSGLSLCFIGVKDHGAVLRTDVRTLSINLGRIMHCKKCAHQTLVVARRRIEADLTDFHVTGGVRAHLSITRIVDRSTHVANHRIGDSGNLAKASLNAPETACSESCLLSHLDPLDRKKCNSNPVDTALSVKRRPHMTCTATFVRASAPDSSAAPPSLPATEGGFQSIMSESFLWHDYETFGADPRRDRPAQFAAIRTDAELKPIGEPVVFYCRPATDLLPQPAACLITGIPPQLAADRGIPEREFAARIFDVMARPGTCTVGYNNFRFDDEFSRHLFWRNFIDPYAREFANGNSRFDLIDLARMTRALRPTGLRWPDREDGLPSFRLEHLAAANGMDTSNAHDALADVEATLSLARLIRRAQPRLWEWALGLRQRHVVERLLRSGRPLLHSSARLPAQWCATAPVLPVAEHPQFRSQWVVWNLRVDPTPFLKLDEDDLTDLMWTPAADLPEAHQRLPVKLIRANRCPMISPLAVLDRACAQRLAIDESELERHAAVLEREVEFRTRLAGLFQRSETTDRPDPELDLYGGFVPRVDQALRDRIRHMDGEELAALETPFSDERLNALLFRYRARHWPDSLSVSERAEWERYRQRRLIEDPDLASIRLDGFLAELEVMRSRHPDQVELLQQLAAWPAAIGLSADRTHFQ